MKSRYRRKPCNLCKLDRDALGPMRTSACAVKRAGACWLHDRNNLVELLFFSVIVVFAIFFTFAIFSTASEIDLFSSLLLTMFFLLKIFKNRFIKKQLAFLAIASLLNEINDLYLISLIKRIDCFNNKVILDNNFLIHHFVLQLDQLSSKIYHVIALRER